MNMAKTITWIVVIVVAVGSCEGSIGLLTNERVCLSERTRLTLSCPSSSHRLVVQEATFYKTQQQCGVQATAACMIVDLSKDIFNECYPRTNCSLDLHNALVSSQQSDTSCFHAAGETYVDIAYKCNKVESGNYMEMCGDQSGESEKEGSLLVLLSPHYPNMTYAHHSCGCVINMQEDLEIDVSIPDFEHVGVRSVAGQPCSPALQFWSNDGQRTVCAEEEDTPFNVHFSRPYTFSVGFQNPALLPARYIIMLQVHHEHSFSVSCRSNFDIPAVSLPTSVHTPYPDMKTERVDTPAGEVTQTRGRDTDSGLTQNPHTSRMAQPTKVAPLIGGGVAALIVIITIAGFSVFLCRRRQKRKQHNTPNSAELNQNVYENNVYMSAGHVNREQSQGHSQDRAGQSQGEDQGQGAQAAAVSTRPRVSFGPLPEKPDFEHVRFENEAEPEQEEEFEEVKDDEDDKSKKEVHRDARSSVRDRIRQFDH